ncbi:MAG: hypothetical protein LBG75_01200 [Candidatus Nomurabacteria bacterium]|jgi:ubiquinone/menaquinone biosynthesis C-methylase UbiE|nr:hypothetical protein [Candidatus Nomurabacteria bacterium]
MKKKSHNDGGLEIETIVYDGQDEYATLEASARVVTDMRRAVDINEEFVEKGQTITPECNPGLGYILSVAPGVAAWMASAKISPSLALDPFYMPGQATVGSIFKVDSASAEWLTNKPLCIALRYRAKIETELSLEHYLAQPKGAKVNSLVLAAGRGRYPLLAAAEAKKAGCEPHLTFVDIDKKALHQIRALANDCDYQDISLVDRDILDLKGFRYQNSLSRALRRLATGSWPLDTPEEVRPRYYDIVSGIGISMYIEDSVWQYPLPHKVLGRESAKKAGVEQLLGQMWRHVKPGGIMLVDAINQGEPDNFVGLQLKTIQTIGWKEMQQRSPEQVQRLISRAGIEPAKITRHADPTGFFSVYKLQKPQA